MNKKLNQEEQDKKKLLWFLWLHDYFHRYYNDKATEKEIQIIKDWDPEKLTGTSSKASDVQVRRGIEKVWESLSVEYGFAQPKKRPTKIFRLRQLLPYAAAILVLMTSTVVYQYRTYDTLQSIGFVFSDEMEYRTGKGDVREFTLPDGSSITLNGNTTLAFVKDEFNGKEREIWLKDGEVFFDVAKNPNKPFMIHTQDADVVVKGTSFSVTAYAKLHKSIVAVRTGKVEVIKDKQINILLPSQTAIIDKKSGAVRLSEIKTSNIATWREGNLTLNHSDADELILRMEHHFDIEIEVEPGLFKDINFSASFDRSTSLKNALDIISEIYGFNYIIKNNTVILHQ